MSDVDQECAELQALRKRLAAHKVSLIRKGEKAVADDAPLLQALSSTLHLDESDIEEFEKQYTKDSVITNDSHNSSFKSDISHITEGKRKGHKGHTLSSITVDPNDISLPLEEDEVDPLLPDPLHDDDVRDLSEDNGSPNEAGCDVVPLIGGPQGDTILCLDLDHEEPLKNNFESSGKRRHPSHPSLSESPISKIPTSHTPSNDGEDPLNYSSASDEFRHDRNDVDLKSFLDGINESKIERITPIDHIHDNDDDEEEEEEEEEIDDEDEDSCVLLEPGHDLEKRNASSPVADHAPPQHSEDMDLFQPINGELIDKHTCGPATSNPESHSVSPTVTESKDETQNAPVFHEPRYAGDHGGQSFPLDSCCDPASDDGESMVAVLFQGKKAGENSSLPEGTGSYEPDFDPEAVDFGEEIPFVFHPRKKTDSGSSYTLDPSRNEEDEDSGEETAPVIYRSRSNTTSGTSSTFSLDDRVNENNGCGDDDGFEKATVLVPQMGIKSPRGSSFTLPNTDDSGDVDDEDETAPVVIKGLNTGLQEEGKHSRPNSGSFEPATDDEFEDDEQERARTVHSSQASNLAHGSSHYIPGGNQAPEDEADENAVVVNAKPQPADSSTPPDGGNSFKLSKHEDGDDEFAPTVHVNGGRVGGDGPHSHNDDPAESGGESGDEFANPVHCHSPTLSERSSSEITLLRRRRSIRTSTSGAQIDETNEDFVLLSSSNPHSRFIVILLAALLTLGIMVVTFSVLLQPSLLRPSFSSLGQSSTDPDPCDEDYYGDLGCSRINAFS